MWLSPPTGCSVDEKLPPFTEHKLPAPFWPGTMLLPILKPRSVYRRPTEHVISPTFQGVKEPGLFQVKHPGFPLDLTSRPCPHKPLSKRSSTDVGAGAHLPLRPHPMGSFLHFLPVTAHLVLSMLPSWPPPAAWFFPSWFPFEPPLCCHLPSQGPQDPTLGPRLTHALNYHPYVALS